MVLKYEPERGADEEQLTGEARRNAEREWKGIAKALGLKEEEARRLDAAAIVAKELIKYVQEK